MSKINNNKAVRLIYIAIGSMFVGIGAVGVFVPGLPTTVFLIIAAYFYIRSSDRLYTWLINNKWFGKYIRDYFEHRGMPLRAKIVALSTMTIFVSLAIIPYSPISVPWSATWAWAHVTIGLAGIIGFWYVGFRVRTR